MVDLLFGGVCVARRKRSFRWLPNLLDGLNEQEVLSRHRLGSAIDHEYITYLMKPKFERQTKNNSVDSAVDLSQVMLTVSVSQIMKLAYSCTAKYNLRLLLIIIKNQSLISLQFKQKGMDIHVHQQQAIKNKTRSKFLKLNNFQSCSYIHLTSST